MTSEDDKKPYVVIMELNFPDLRSELREWEESKERSDRYSVWFIDGPREHEEWFAKLSDAIDAHVNDLIIRVENEREREAEEIEKFTLEINTENAAFGESGEDIRAYLRELLLEQVIPRLDTEHEGNINDYNGNLVGHWKLEKS